MALIKCPECSKEISDKATSCPNCGYPIEKTDIEGGNDLEILKEIPDFPYTICPECGGYNPTGLFICKKCEHKYTMGEYKVLSPQETVGSSFVSGYTVKNHEFNGVYRYTLFGKKQEVYCPRCKSEDCSCCTETNITPAKTKTKYSANLNPLHPFTLLNKKEKVLKKEQVQEIKKFVCNRCGKKFY